MMRLVLIAGSWAAAVVEELEQMPQDIRVDKYRMSGFWDTPLDSYVTWEEPRFSLPVSMLISVCDGDATRCKFLRI